MARGQTSCIVLLHLLHRCLSGLNEDVPSNTDPTYIDSIVFEHNKYRSEVTPTASNMFYMSWDEDLAKTALAWAKLCINYNSPWNQIPGMAHPDFPLVGENIWVRNISGDNTRTDVATALADSCNFTLSKNRSGKCAQLSQVVWAQTYKVGCGVAYCNQLTGHRTGSPKIIVVCNYAPPGNVIGELAYTEGTPCTGCAAADMCENKLCRNRERDAVAHSSWQPPWACGGGTARAPSQFYSALLSLILSVYIWPHG